MTNQTLESVDSASALIGAALGILRGAIPKSLDTEGASHRLRFDQDDDIYKAVGTCLYRARRILDAEYGRLVGEAEALEIRKCG